MRRICFWSALVSVCLAKAASAQLVISGNENKIDLTSGGQKVIPNAAPDSLSILDFSVFPPKVTTIDNVPNTVAGPPSNIAISPDHHLALIANSFKLDPTTAAGTAPENYIHILDLTATPPKIIGQVKTDAQPSGLSFTPDGRLALVANRAGGTVNVLSIDKTTVTNTASIKVCEPAESASDVAITPDGKTAFVSIQKGGVLVVLHIDKGKVTTDTPLRKISVYGQPYRVVVTPDGKQVLTAGAGYGNGVDMDALSIVDITGSQPRTIDHVAIGTTPESFEISPNGKLVAATVMDGSNTAADNPFHANAGTVVLLARRENDVGFERQQTFAVVQRVPVGRIPEGVAFTSDGKYLVVQCHPDRKIWIFRVNNNRIEDTGQRIDMPGMPSSLRASP